MKIQILYGSSCIGKSTRMCSMDNSYYKLEMDDCKYWLLPENKRVQKCIDYLIENIKINNNKKDMIVEKKTQETNI